ncbi:MAG: hypothetical protein ABIL09_14440, partial [Gemmatimonadota bacterium]
LLDALQDERLSGAKAKAAVLQLCRHVAAGSAGASSREFRRCLVVDLCAAILLAKVVPGEGVSLSKLVRLLVEGRATLERMGSLALKSVAQEPFVDRLRDCLEARLRIDAAPAVAAPPAGPSAGDDDEAGESPAGEAGGAATGEGDAEAGGAAPSDDGVDEDGVDDEDEVDDGAGGEGSPDGVDRFLEAFHAALEAVYQAEASSLGFTQDNNQVLAARLRAISQYHPLRSRIPSMEEAQRLSRQSRGDDSGRQRALDRARAGGGRSAPRPVMTARPVRSGGSSAPAAGGVLSAGAGARVPAVIKAPAGIASGDDAVLGKRKPHPGGAPRAAGSVLSAATPGSAASAAAGGDASPDVDQPADPAAAPPGDERIVVARIQKYELTEVVSRIGQLLSVLEQLDPRVWQLFVEPGEELADPRQLAEDLLTQDSGAAQAYGALRTVASQQGLRSVLTVPPDRHLNPRRFDLEAAAFINTISNNRRELEADARQLIPLPRMLDNAAAGLVRLEALRCALRVARESGTDFDPAAATARYEEVLSDLTFMASREAIEPARQRADADASAVGQAVVADVTVDRMIAASCAYARQLEADGHTGSIEAVNEAVAAAPLLFEGIEPDEELPGQLPAKYSDPTKLGEVYDRVRTYVFERVWPLLQPRHKPEETAARLDAELRGALKGTVRMEPRRERHHKNPKLALAVVGLDALTGNPELAHLFVRAT